MLSRSLYFESVSIEVADWSDGWLRYWTYWMQDFIDICPCKKSWISVPSRMFGTMESLPGPWIQYVYQAFQ